MVWTCGAFFMLGFAQIAFSALAFEENSASVAQPVALLPARDELDHSFLSPSDKRSSSINRLEDVEEDLIDQKVFNSPLIYALQEGLRQQSPSQRVLSRDSVIDEGQLLRKDFIPRAWNQDTIFPIEELTEDNEVMESLDDGNLLTRAASVDRDDRTEQMDTEYRNKMDQIWLRKRRLQMKGPGLFGSLNNRKMLGQKSLMGYTGSKNKGLVLSIDLGIKALRDAIMHAKFKQKNRKLQAQAQKNMRLLHTIGKRRVPTKIVQTSP